MVKAYLRYRHTDTLGVIVSPNSDVVRPHCRTTPAPPGAPPCEFWPTSLQLYDATGKLAVASTLETVTVWNLRKRTQVILLLAGACTQRGSLAARFRDNCHDCRLSG
jgi:hypothetical protein